MKVINVMKEQIHRDDLSRKSEVYPNVGYLTSWRTNSRYLTSGWNSVCCVLSHPQLLLVWRMQPHSSWTQHLELLIIISFLSPQPLFSAGALLTALNLTLFSLIWKTSQQTSTTHFDLELSPPFPLSQTANCVHCVSFLTSQSLLHPLKSGYSNSSLQGHQTPPYSSVARSLGHRPLEHFWSNLLQY